MTETVEKLQEDALIKGVKQLLLSTKGYLQDANSVEDMEETLVHLEERDGDFHRYDLVKGLRAQVEESLGPLIDSELHRHALDQYDQIAGNEHILQQITDKLIHSQQRKEMSGNLKQNVQWAVQYLLDNFDEEFRHSIEESQAIQKHNLFSSDGESSFGSSFNQSSFVFPNQEHFQHIAENLEKSNFPENRIEGLISLVKASSADILCSDYWPQFKKGLMHALEDDDIKISSLSMTFCAKAFASCSPSTKEVFFLLVDYLIGQFQPPKSYIPKVKNGLDINKADTVKLLKVFRLLNEFQKQIPQYWIRFPERFVEELIESMLKLIEITYKAPMGSQPQMMPLHFLAVLDPQAKWFMTWMHGHYSRSILLKNFESCKVVVIAVIKHCMEFCGSRKVPFDLMSEASDTPGSTGTGEGRRKHYTGPEIEYIYFIHSIHFISKLLCFKHGRDLFPITVKEKEEPVSITKFLVSLTQLLTDPTVQSLHPHSQGVFELCYLVTEFLVRLCQCDDVSEICMCHDDVTSALLSPIAHWLDGSSDQGGNMASETTRVYIGEILSVVASNSRGRRHLLYGEREERFTRTKSAPAHTITEFVCKGLVKNLPRESGPPPSCYVIEAYMYVCRQLYSTCEGLYVLYPYNLHTVISNVWKATRRQLENAKTPTPSSDNSDDNEHAESRELIFWEETLKDNLLNFATTPKGLLLLQQTGAIDDCVSYMCSRYAKRLQVSKREKFGYGYMISQVAGTTPGIVALDSSGFFNNLIRELWSTLECDSEDNFVYTPRIWPIDPIDKSAHKYFMSLVHTLSSFPSVYELLRGGKLPAKDSYGFRELPETVVDLLDRLIVVNTEAKIHSLFNYEQSHIFGLRVLSAMVSSLDVFLLLQTQYDIHNVLLTGQEANCPEDRQGEIIVDMLSLERNYILVKSYLIGGPSERIIPPRELTQIQMKKKFKYPLFSCYPVPREYSPNIAGRSAMKQENELSKFLSETTKKNRHVKSTSWLDKCSKVFLNLMSSKPETVKGSLLTELLEKSLPVLNNSQEEAIFPQMEYTGTDAQLKSYKLSSIKDLGVRMAVRYGMHLKVLTSSAEAAENLSQIMKQTGYFLKQQQKHVDSPLRTMQGEYVGFDWFAATIFLMMNGHVERTWKFLYRFSCLASSGYLWVPRLYCSMHLPPGLMESGISPLLSSTGHNVELVLQAELPLVYSAFRMSGFAPSQICYHWLQQCFWNYLDWLDICHYVCVCILRGVDYQVYTCVALLKYLQRDILQHQQDGDLAVFLKEESIKGFRLGAHLDFIYQLQQKFRKTILPEMLNITQP
ncbi:unnamed protein product [Owenia fusiformis]|uniref:Protein broad-minded n=1 Tax=Owenia fusiformis TaxID=6347 RepID=A0A8J1Y9G6_OWEFU|nr:unnamed protein product [Owenia fusiformis]